MRKVLAVFTLLILVLTASSSSSAVNINPDTDIHMAVGGLYSLISALSLHSKPVDKPESLRKYFADVPLEWPGNIKIERVKNDVWAAVSITKYPTAKTFLRSHSEELGIADSAGGKSWVSGDFAWIKAGTITNGKFTAAALQASLGSGNDSSFLFLRKDGRDSWWLANPQLSRKASDSVMKRWGVKQDGLHRPSGIAVSIYDSVRPSAVRKPAEMNTKREKSFSDNFEQEMGDVIFKPVPKVGGQDNNNF